MLEQHGIIAGKYRLDRALAQGGMGSVWVARHLQLEIDVAIKLMAPQYASLPEARMRFEREAKASAQLRSPYVVHMYDYGAAEDGTLFLAMELLQGEDLDARLKRIGRFTPAALVSLVEQVCKGLECAHDAGLVHRDLKPANLFMARQGRDETVKVLDFGIAKAMGPALVSPSTKTGTLLGSPHYMSPEQVRRSKDVDPRSDLWSLGVILFQCLTGRVPFAGDELGDVLVAICTDDIPLASQIVPELGPEVDRFLLRALQRNPDQRFQSARELAEVFAAVVHPSPAAWRSPSIPAIGGAFAPPAETSAPQLSAAPAPALAAASVAASGPVPAPFPSSTLSASGNTLATLPERRRSIGALAALLGGALVLGLAAAFVFLRGHSPDAGARADGDHASAVPAPASAAPPLGSSATRVPPEASASSTQPVTSPPTHLDPPSPPAQPAGSLTHPLVPPKPATRPAPPLPPPSKATASPGKPQEPHRDPLDHR